MQITYIAGHDNVGRSFLKHIPKYFLDRLCGLSVTSVYVKYCQISCAYCLKALKGVIWIVASRSEPFSKIRHAHWGFPVENLDSKKPPRRLALEDYVSLFS